MSSNVRDRVLEMHSTGMSFEDIANVFAVREAAVRAIYASSFRTPPLSEREQAIINEVNYRQYVADLYREEAARNSEARRKRP